MRGLLFAASLAFGLDGETLCVSNLTLFLPFAGAQAVVDSPWTLELKNYTVAQLRALIPSLGDDEQ